MQTFLFQNGRKMTSKKVGLIVSSASSGISSVVADAKRLIPDGIFTENLWIRSSQVSNCHSMIYSWISSTGIGTTTGVSTVKGEKQASVSVIGNRLSVSGDFKSVDIYDAAGRKLVTSSQKVMDIKELTACNVYVAIARGNERAASYKFTVK